MFRSKSAALEELGNVYDRMVIEQSTGLEQAVRELEMSNRELSLEIENRKRLEADRERLHGELMIASRRAGMADIATGVLHNVGNVLNSINVSSTLLTDRLGQSKVSQLQRASDLIEQHAQDLTSFITQDPRGQQLPGFLRALASHLTDEHAEALKELAALTERVEHAKTIVSAQQSYAGVLDMIESVDVATSLDEALRLNDVSAERHRIAVVRDFVDLPKIRVDRQKLLQILVNLINNAKDALMDRDRQDRQLTLRTRSSANECVRIEIVDNGIGIAAGNLDRIFVYGFTTKKMGHGFGLHSCANSARELGGSLSAASDGPERGATFTLELPLQATGDQV